MKETKFGSKNDAKKYSKINLISTNEKYLDSQNSNESLSIRETEKCKIIITPPSDGIYESEEIELIEKPFVRGTFKQRKADELAGPSVSSFSSRLSTIIRISLRLGPKRSTMAHEKFLQEKIVKDVCFFFINMNLIEAFL